MFAIVFIKSKKCIKRSIRAARILRKDPPCVEFAYNERELHSYELICNFIPELYNSFGQLKTKFLKKYLARPIFGDHEIKRTPMF